MKKITFLFIVACAMLQLNAQQISLVPDPIFQISSNQLFSLTVINTSNSAGAVTLRGKVFSASGQLIISEELSTILNASESKHIEDRSNVKRLFVAPKFQRYYQSGTLPPLDYTICYEAFFASDLSSKAEACTDVLSSDFISILPLYPSSEETLHQSSPFFSWNNLLLTDLPITYNFKLVQLEAGQNPQAGLRRNLPLVDQQQLTENQMDYPVDAPKLTHNSSYAWQVELNLEGETFAKSNAFTFTYKESEDYVDFPRDLSYIDIKKIREGGKLYAVGAFKFKYPSDYKTQLKVALHAQKKGKLSQIDLEEDELEVATGVNKYDFDLKEQVYLKHKKSYQITIKEVQSKKTYQLDLIYINPDYLH